VVLVFKKSPGKELPEQKKINYALSHQRVEIKHCIGMLKNRWQLLKWLQNQILGVRSARRANWWIQVCVILHNFLLPEDVNWSILAPEFQGMREEGKEEVSDEDCEADANGDAAEDTQLRTALFDRSPGENLWHWHASATPCVFNGTRC
jgi:hypothetical protein